MSFRDRLLAEAGKVQDKVREEVAEFVAGPDGAASVEGFILGLVRANRDDEDDEVSEKDVRKTAKKRRRRLGLASFAAGPMAGVAGEATDLYSETATVCDLVELHRLPLSDAQVGGHMLVLWGVTDDPALGAAALDGTGRPIAELFTTRVAADYQAAESVPAKIKVIWQNRDVLADARGANPFGRVIKAGRDAKDLIERAELQLGVRLP